ncbi:hypothetical protein [Shewanella sp. 10N.286.48.A6]|uniref:hypothetical protein n=1 Tax=Shewanella sp. 10N.286.48.A6 TaxID=1880833 RepID=UPI0039A73153
MNSFFILDENPWEELGGGVYEEIVAYTDDLMAVHLCFDKERDWPSSYSRNSRPNRLCCSW